MHTHYKCITTNLGKVTKYLTVSFSSSMSSSVDCGCEGRVIIVQLWLSHPPTEVNLPTDDTTTNRSYISKNLQRNCTKFNLECTLRCQQNTQQELNLTKLSRLQINKVYPSNSLPVI